MNFKNKNIIKSISFSGGIVFVIICCILFFANPLWNTLDYKATDFFYKYCIERGEGPPISNKIAYVNLTNSTYSYFGHNYLDRIFLAKLNCILAQFNPESVFYDIIFSAPSAPVADSLFSESLGTLGCAVLPAGFRLSTEPINFEWKDEPYYKKLHNEFLFSPVEFGQGHPYYGVRVLSQLPMLYDYVAGHSHISAESDPDGISRHLPLILKIDSSYLPATALSMFLNYVKVPPNKIEINWGNYVRIPAIKGSELVRDLYIPIDDQGLVFIPYPAEWEKTPQMVEAHKVVELANDPDNTSQLLDFFEGKFIFIGDISIGISDLGQTPLEKNVPLVAIHAALMNSFLTNSFYTKWSLLEIIELLLGISLLLYGSAILKSNSLFFIATFIIYGGMIGLTLQQMQHFRLFPLVTVFICGTIISLSYLVVLHSLITKDQAFIRGAFSKYIPTKVVDNLVNNPDQLKLGGENRVLTILFSDIEGFTTISEKMEPKVLVRIVNSYLTEMTLVIFENAGIIDKYLGDGIMAEFGAPLYLEKHADAAVISGLKMQEALVKLNKVWASEGLPVLRCRIGINTGDVVVGNIGSAQVFDYTVLGDNANLASRLEGANQLYGTRLLVSEATYLHLTKNKFRTRLLDSIIVKGRTMPVRVYEVFGFAEDEPLSEALESYYRHFQTGLQHYFVQQFDAAFEEFTLALTLQPNDLASLLFMKRIKNLQSSGIPPEWDGSIDISKI